MIQPLIGPTNSQAIDSTFIIDIGQSIAQKMGNTQAFVQNYELDVVPENMKKELMHLDGLKVGFYDSKNKNNAIHIAKKPSALIKEHWNMGTLQNAQQKLASLNNEQRVIALNTGAYISLNYNYQFKNVEKSFVNFTILGYENEFPDPQCDYIPDSNKNAANCTWSIKNLFENASVPDRNLPPTYNLTLNFQYEYTLLPDQTQVDFTGKANLQMENTVFESVDQITYFACDLEKLTCSIPLASGSRVFFGANRMTFVATQGSDPDVDTLVVNSTNPVLKFKVKPVVRQWLSLVAAIAPFGALFLLFCCLECCLFCCINCRPYRKRGYGSSNFSTLDSEKIRLLNERNANIFRD